ncbi:conserved Plasmodium protein, unknown function [Plasmodium vivax]|uniref:Uncharacterized protein n=6 Tax=Plasmodium vivax TaxID=5855 RepID=A5K9Q0_PLAVS|nr:hypothetical protein, conserved [Plasmodium vivax]KMZ82886.1 hypothetical protein PVIIG_04637 [Plasmodium vivax India VII]KMZ89184.1 hypothetical protein PVBG_03534 [Plasmodium vivax Brazil I]KMZ95507.1 hypothetical protein PVMG_04300 [Plasmodium vivax Mauritania I]KNA02140.1 hypothetical protein PVNG_04983 [Plasmodium vivax North Korean]EDL43788.1 hypothetical protein, conserved [Plasmodium vivax]|eukprot:XP_001613515.1 hypothetical protein [Plasmodium vivax Sal-1]
MKLLSASPCTLYITLLFVLLVHVTVGGKHMNNQDFAETEQAARAIRKLLNGEIDTIKLENGNKLKIRSSDEKDDAHKRHNDKTNYSFIDNSEEENVQTNLLRKNETVDAGSKIVEDQEDFYILDNESIEAIANKISMENKFHEFEAEAFAQSLKDIIRSLNN